MIASRSLAAAVVSAGMVLGSAAWAEEEDVIVLSSVKDNTLYESVTGALSNGSGQAFYVGRTNQLFPEGLSLRRGLIAFDVAGNIPAGSIITSATLTLYAIQVAPTMPMEGSLVELFLLTQDWGEAGSLATGLGDAAQTGDATWLHTFFNTAFWNTPGGDFAPAPSAATTVIQTSAYAWSDPQMVADVQSWLDDPAGNFGWLLRGDESLHGTAIAFVSREGFATFQPALTINYIIPEPGMLPVMGALWGMLLGIRPGRRLG
jgi:hypothetical protein